MNDAATKKTTIAPTAARQLKSGKPAAKPLFSPTGPKPLKKKEQLQMFRGIGSMLKAQINTADVTEP